MKKNTYTINHAEEKIIMTKEFAKKAGVIDSHEYRLFTQFRKDFPSYGIEERKATKNDNKITHKGLSLENMKKYLATRENAADALNAFELAKDYYKGQSAYYSKMKAWFLSNYKEDYDKYTPAAAVAESTPTEETATENPAPAPIVDTTTKEIAA